MATVVVCDDDPSVRTNVTVTCEEAGLEVVAETDRGGDAIELVRRFGVDVLVLEPTLSDGSGEAALQLLQSERSGVAVVVFTAYASDPWRLLRLGVREVVEKPAFEVLQRALANVGSQIEEKVPADERRTASRAVPDAPRMWRSPAGVSASHDLHDSILGLEVGDAALAVTVVGLEALESDVGPLLTADCRLAIGATLRDQL